MALALHTVTVCDLANGGFACEATGVVGPSGRVFYVSPTSVYVWMNNAVWQRQRLTQPIAGLSHASGWIGSECLARFRRSG